MRGLGEPRALVFQGNSLNLPASLHANRAKTFHGRHITLTAPTRSYRHVRPSAKRLDQAMAQAGHSTICATTDIEQRACFRGPESGGYDGIHGVDSWMGLAG